MDSLEKLKTIFSVPDLKKLDVEISTAGDVLVGHELKGSEINIVNFLLRHIENYQDSTIIENILNVCLRVMIAHQVFSGFDLDVVLPCLNRLNTECSSYILTFLGFSGNQKYRSYIEPFLSVDTLKEEAMDALRDLDYTSGKRTDEVPL